VARGGRLTLTLNYELIEHVGSSMSIIASTHPFAASACDSAYARKAEVSSLSVSQSSLLCCSPFISGHNAPASCNKPLIPAQLCREDSSGVPPLQ
jgi:hypothetical protein